MTKTTVALPFGEGYLCPCGEIWRAEDTAEHCGHVPGVGRRVPVRGDRWRRAELLYRHTRGELMWGLGLAGLTIAYIGFLLAMLLVT